MRRAPRFALLLLCSLALAQLLDAQLPFYTDDPAVTDAGKWHFEFFNELDALQHPQYPNLRQNTANYKLNYGLPYHLELDLDAPYLAILRAVGTPNSTGVGDTDMGIKWEFHQESKTSHLPALGASLYIEFPTGDSHNQLGSGLTDYWLNLIAQKSITDKTRANVNLGYLFAGNTSTGVIGIQQARGHVYTGGISLLHDFTPRLTLGAEIYGGYTDNIGLGRRQFQVLAGGTYEIRHGFALSLGLLGGKYEASPRIGAQIGFAVDFPDVIRPSEPPAASIH
ncbi:MAG TPA: transporter [Bryobacteraceae bacterium]|nr:transporter [Bryobacteraceae bacterium]